MLILVPCCKWLRYVPLLVIHDYLTVYPPPPPRPRKKRLQKPEMLCEVLSPMTESTYGGLKLLVGLMKKCSCLDEVPGC